MKHWMRRSILLLAILVMAAAQSAAYEVPQEFTTLDEAVEEFMQAYSLNENNFSVSYYNTVTGESYAYNDLKFMSAGSTYKLPLNMYYYELEQEGVLAPDVYISRVGMTLDKAHYESMVDSDNDVSIGLLYNLGQFRDYKELMLRYFDNVAEDEIESIYWTNNYYCTRMMMGALMHLYDYRADFTEIIGYMKQAQPGLYFKAGVEEYEVAHKYGWWEGAVNDVGIIYTPQPILLAVYTQSVGETVVAEAAKLFTAYTVWKGGTAAEEEPAKETLEIEYIPLETEQSPEIEEAAEEAPEQVPVQVPKEQTFSRWMAAAGAGIVLLIAGTVTAVVLVRKKKRQEVRE